MGDTSPRGMISLSCALWKIAKIAFWSSERPKHSTETWWQFDNSLVISTWAVLHCHENTYPLWLDPALKILFQLWSMFSFSVLIMFQRIYSGTIYGIFSLCVSQTFSHNGQISEIFFATRCTNIRDNKIILGARIVLVFILNLIWA